MTVADALKAVAAYVEDKSGRTSWSGSEYHSQEQRADKAARLRVIAQDIRALADASGTRQVRAEEYDALKRRWQEVGFGIPDGLAINVANATHTAEMKELFDVWTDREDGRLRVVVRHGDGMPPYYATTDMQRLGTVPVDDDIAADVRNNGFHSMSTNVPFDPNAVLGDALSASRGDPKGRTRP